MQLEKTTTENALSKSSVVKGDGARGKEGKEIGRAFSHGHVGSMSSGGRGDCFVREIGGCGDRWTSM